MIKKTFLGGALFLLLLAPSVSHASAPSDWFSELFGGTSAETQIATALPATAAWLDLKVNDSDGPVSVPDGTPAQLHWVVNNITGVSNCHVGYPGASGHVSDAVAVFGSKSVTLYPSRSSVDYVELVCTRGTEQGHDFVELSAYAQDGSTSAGGSSGSAVNSGSGAGGGSVSGDSGGHGVSNTGNGGAAGATMGTNAANGGTVSGFAHDIGGYINTAGKAAGNTGGTIGTITHAIGGYVNTAEKGALRTMDRVTSVSGRVINTVLNFFGLGNNGAGNGKGPGVGSGTGGNGKGPGVGSGTGGAGGKPGGLGGAGSGSTGGKGGGAGSGGSGGKPAIPDDDKKPSKPKGK